jgi:ABC-2 type transport system ATP-binding protein
MTSEPAIMADGLRKSFGELNVLAGIDMRVGRGTIHALLGPNGAGKTTLVRILATLTRADGGTARVAGFDIATERHLVRRSISLTGQYAAVDDLQTGAENLRMMARLVGLSGRAARARVDELLTRFDLVGSAGRRAGTYSGGMRRRLDLAASLVGTPAVIFLDEPTTGLDLPSRQAMWEVITGLADSGVAVLLTTQYLEEADLLADRIAVLDAGRIIADDTAAQLKTRVAEQRLDIVIDAASYDDVEHFLGRRVVHADAARRTLGVATDGSAAHVRSLLDEIDPQRQSVSHFAIRTATLDDVFLALTGHGTATSNVDSLAFPDSSPAKETAHV